MGGAAELPVVEAEAACVQEDVRVGHRRRRLWLQRAHGAAGGAQRHHRRHAPGRGRARAAHPRAAAAAGRPARAVRDPQGRGARRRQGEDRHAAAAREPDAPHQDGPVEAPALHRRPERPAPARRHREHPEAHRARPSGDLGRGRARRGGAAQRHHGLRHPPALHARLQARHHRVPAHQRGVRVDRRRGRRALPALAGARRRGVRHRGGAVGRRAADADDAQHVPLRRCVGQERHARRAAAQGDHQRRETRAHAVVDGVREGRVRVRPRGVAARADVARLHDARVGGQEHGDLLRPRPGELRGRGRPRVAAGRGGHDERGGEGDAVAVAAAH
mmetsp:Transcript_13843/g.48237  ORF Transcript_13843/g.48237 Transcript_13843/m.48237 type:complete len:332 (+) Transcript_13843:3231-4226(+)